MASDAGRWVYLARRHALGMSPAGPAHTTTLRHMVHMVVRIQVEVIFNFLGTPAQPATQTRPTRTSIERTPNPPVRPTPAETTTTAMAAAGSAQVPATTPKLV